jgi:glutathione peroxidase-family protein
VLGFPCNQFGAQEPGTDEEILEFARSKYDVNFQMFLVGPDGRVLERFEPMVTPEDIASQLDSLLN